MITQSAKETRQQNKQREDWNKFEKMGGRVSNIEGLHKIGGYKLSKLSFKL